MKEWKLFLQPRLAVVLTIALVLSCLPTSMLSAENVVPDNVERTNWSSVVDGQMWEQDGSTVLTEYTSYLLDEEGNLQYNSEGEPATEVVSIDPTSPAGTKKNPIAISTPEELILFGKLSTDSTVDKYYIFDGTTYDMQGEDYYMTPLFPTFKTASDMPSGGCFEGILIGNQASITNACLQNYTDKNQIFMGGLFSNVSGAIWDLSVSGTMYAVPSNNTTGTLIGQAEGGNSFSSIINCNADITLVSLDTAKTVSRGIGGLIGSAVDVDIINCNVATYDLIGPAYLVGGLAASTDNCNISGCSVSVEGDIEAYDDDGYGCFSSGFIGLAQDSSVIGCTVTVDGNITASASKVSSEAIIFNGGLIGCMVGTGKAVDCTVNVNGNIYSMNGENLCGTGGLVGCGYEASNNTIANCAVKTGITSGDGIITVLGTVGINYDSANTTYSANQPSYTEMMLSEGVCVRLQNEDHAEEVSVDSENILTMSLKNTANAISVSKGRGNITLPSGLTYVAVTENGEIRLPENSTLTYGPEDNRKTTTLSDTGDGFCEIWFDDKSRLHLPVGSMVDGSTITSEYVIDTITGKVWKPETPVETDVTIHFLEEKISFTDTLEANAKADFTSSFVKSGDSISDFIGKTIYVRVAAKDIILPSDVLTVAIPSRPDAPTGITGVKTSFKGKTDGKISGLSEGMEWKQKDADKWTACTSETVTGLSAGTYMVRTKATDSNFSGMPAEVCIASGTKPSVTQAPLSIETPTQKPGSLVTEEEKESARTGLNRPIKSGSRTNRLRWVKTKGADGYFIFASLCRKGERKKIKKKIKTILSGDVTTFLHKNLKKNTWYRYQIKAYKVINGKKVVIGSSLELYCKTSGGKYTNPNGIKVSKKRIVLKKGKTTRIKVSLILPKGKKTQYHTRKIRYIVSNKKMISVSSKGKIKARQKGKCMVYAIAQNGVYKKIKVIVK